MRLTFICLIVCGFYSAIASYQVEVDSLYQRAYRLLESNPDSALALGEIAALKASKAGLELEEAKSLFIQAWIYRQREELGKAFVLYLRALEILRPLDTENAKIIYSKILLNTGGILEYHYAYPQALQYYDEGIHVSIAYGLESQLLKFYNNKSDILRQLKDYEQALALVDLALGAARERGNEERIMTFLNQQGLIYKDMGLYEEARASYRQIIDFEYKELDPEEYRGRGWHNLAVTYVEEERYQEAAEAYQQALRQKELEGDEERLYITYLDLGEVYYLKGNFEEAYQTEQKALALYDDMLLLPDHYAIFRLLSKITYALGDYDQSHTYSEQFVSVNEDFLQEQKKILQIKDQYKMELLTAGFFLEQEADQAQQQLRTILVLLTIVLVFFIAWITYEKIKQSRIRRSIRSVIYDMEME